MGATCDTIAKTRRCRIVRWFDIVRRFQAFQVGHTSNTEMPLCSVPPSSSLPYSPPALDRMPTPDSSVFSDSLSVVAREVSLSLRVLRLVGRPLVRSTTIPVEACLASRR
jgi:hypothetical protein